MKRSYFVTGCTGAVGSALIPYLLESKDNKIWALIRADSYLHAQQRLDDLMAFWGLDDIQQQQAIQQITPVLGDMDKTRFGIADQSYEDISQQCTHIIHCAGVVRMNLPLDVAITHAVGSTKNIVALALACKENGQLEKIDFVSTVGVGGKMQTAVPERWLTEVREFHNSYEASKAQAEDYLHQQIEDHQLPVTIHRPSMVVGEQNTGRIIHFQIFYYICDFITGNRTLGLLPSLQGATLDTIPVDYVAKILKWSSENTVSRGQIFHLSSGPELATSLTVLKQQVREQFKSKAVAVPRVVISLPKGLFAGIIKIIIPLLNEKGRKASKALPIFLEYLSDKQTFSNEKTLAFISKHNGPSLPDPTHYLQIIIDYYLKKQHKNSIN